MTCDVFVHSLVAIARGEQEYFDPSGIPTATEAVKSNALMRCCKDLGIASELWDPRFIREFKAKHAVEIFAEHIPTKKKYAHHLFAYSVADVDTGENSGDVGTSPNLTTLTKSRYSIYTPRSHRYAACYHPTFRDI